ncbi:MAG: ThuA domain-containing protein [Planctomycetota bacterium]|nr:MAG: ThuA domain-containing protein [Planctomycetota bacterium]
MPSSSDHPVPDMRVLVFSKTAGFRHGSIPLGIKAIRALGDRYAFDVHATEDAAIFNDLALSAYDAVIFLSTTGDILNDEQQAAFERYIHAGGGYVGIHAASDTEYDWPWYGKLVGAYFQSHPPIQPATIHVIDRAHVSTSMLPEQWQRRDEWYNFRSHPDHVKVLAKLDESTYSGGTMNNDHPIAWYHQFEGGRAFYTAGGHTNESFAEELFLRHLTGGIFWAAGRSHLPE